MIHHPLTDAGIVKFQNDYKAVFGDSVKNPKCKILHTALCAAGVTKSLFIAEPNKIWLAIPPALNACGNEE